MLFLEYYDNLSDVEVSDGLTVNLRYQAFVGLGMEDEIPEPTTLVEFRNRLGEEVFKVLFDELVRQLKGKGLLSEKVSSIDATHMEADIARKSIINLLRQGKGKLISAIQRQKFQWGKELENRYPAVEDKGRKSSDSELEAEMRNTAALLKELEGQIKEDEYIKKLKEELGKISRGELGLVSFEDMDARWGHKSKEKSFTGYKAHVSMDDSGIVTSADVFSGEQSEATKNNFGKLLHDDESKGVKSECVVADGLYDGAPAQQLSEELGYPIYTPCRHGPQGLEREYFHFDDKGNLRCRSYNYGYKVNETAFGSQYQFYGVDCAGCLSRKSCLKKNEHQKNLWLSKCCEVSMRQDKQLRVEALEQRKRIEAKFGEAKKWHNMARARYRGRWRVGIQVFMTFFVINAKRMVKLMANNLAPPGSLGKCCPVTG
jgi:IS5 family transposase